MPDIIIQAFQQAFQLILSGNSEFYATVFRTIYVSGVGTLLACTWSIPIAVILGIYNFRGKWFIKGCFNALIGVPTVALGLLLYLFLSKQGEFGFLNLLYTVNGIMIGQAFLVTPIIVSFTANALNAADVQIRDLARTLGASGLRTNLAVMRETVWSMVLSVTAAFNRGFGELGIATIVGGGLWGETTVLTTSIAMETSFGYFDVAMAYAIVLMTIVFSITIAINIIERIKAEDLPTKRRRFFDWVTTLWRR
jgi:tungstate transport system permease protein